MLTKNQAKKIRSLGIKKYRERYGEFIAEGDKIIKELINSNLQINSIYATPTWIEKNKNFLSSHLTIVSLTPSQLKNISQQTTPNQALALVNIPQQKQIPDPQNKVTLLIENIQDPGNLGTIIRTAEWFGINNIICSGDTVDLYNPKVIQATMGSFCRINIFYTNIINYLNMHKNKVPVYGAVLNGQNAFKQKFQKNAILVVGNESKGISVEVENFITHKVTIPPYDSDNELKPDSLNASVAAAILMSLFRMNTD